MREIKVAIIGAGSTYSPELVDGFIKRQESLKVKEFALMDINAERVGICGGLIERMCRKHFPEPPKVTYHTKLEPSIVGADYIVTQLRVGGFEARANDELIPLKYGIIGQETTGPGGLMKALRTIPVMLDIAKTIERVAPDAFLINFTNPSGIITETCVKHSKVKVVGLCNSTITIKSWICDFLGLPKDNTYISYFGLNHLGWFTGIQVDGVDKTEELFDKIIESGKMDGLLGYNYNKKLLKISRLLPCGYLQYYYHNIEVFNKLKAQDKSRAQVLMGVDRDILNDYQDVNLKDKPPGLELRGGAWYSDAAVSLIDSIENNTRGLHIVNIANKGAIHDLPNDSVVEIPAVVGKSMVTPLVIGELPKAVKGLVENVNNYEALAVEAGVTGSMDTAFLALCAHPFIRSIDDAEKMFNELVNANQKYLNLK